jgi:hypothetical protein
VEVGKNPKFVTTPIFKANMEKPKVMRIQDSYEPDSKPGDYEIAIR